MPVNPFDVVAIVISVTFLEAEIIPVMIAIPFLEAAVVTIMVAIAAHPTSTFQVPIVPIVIASTVVIPITLAAAVIPVTVAGTCTGRTPLLLHLVSGAVA